MARIAGYGSIVDAFGGPPEVLDASELFHEASKLRRYGEDLLRAAARDRTLNRLVSRQVADASGGDAPRSAMVRAARNAERRALPIAARTSETAALARLARRRISVRSFAPDEIALHDLAEALRLTYGFTGGCVGGERLLLRRPIPSPGALYSLELYVFAARVASLRAGLYHYEIASHELVRLRGSEAEDRFHDVLTSLGGVPGCAAYVVVTSVLERLRWKYGQRAYRLAMLEAGHAGQQLCTVVTALGLAGCPIQAFLDDELADLLGVDGVSELPLHVVGIGVPARAAAEKGATSPAAAAARGLCIRPPLGAALAELRDWEAVDRAMTGAFQEIACGRATAARSRLVALEARLAAPDATIRDYLKLTEISPPPRLFAAEGILLHATGTTGDPADLLRALGQVRAEVMRFFGVTGAPAVFVEHPARTARPITLVGDRAVQRKICLPADADAEALRHELVHAVCAPPNVVFAEGLACLFASGARAIREAELHLEEDAPERLQALFRRRAPGTTGGEALRDEDAWLVYPLAGSFLLFLDERMGRAALLAYSSLLVRDGSEATAIEQEERFAEVFGTPLEDAVAAWWRARSGGRRT